MRVTDKLMQPGNTALAELRIVVDDPRRPLYRCCLDWTERRPHVAGALGAALLRFYLEERWLARVRDSRKLVVTTRGKEMFKQAFGIDDGFFPV